MGMCVFSRDNWSSGFLLEILSVHPIMVNGSKMCKNFYYIPFERLDNCTSNEQVDQVRLDHWIQNIQVRTRIDTALVNAKEEAVLANQAKSRFICK